MADNGSSALAGLHILVVEDEYMVAELLCVVLEDLGCIVVGPFAGVTEALDAIRDHPLDGALLDANLDGHSSAPVASALTAASIPYVVATGYGALPLPDWPLDGVPRISKPFSTSELAATLKAALLP